jgi:hypothetical protein
MRFQFGEHVPLEKRSNRAGSVLRFHFGERVPFEKRSDREEAS